MVAAFDGEPKQVAERIACHIRDGGNAANELNRVLQYANWWHEMRQGALAF